MKYLFGLFLFFLLMPVAISAQQTDASSAASSVDEEEFSCGLTNELVVVKIWVTSSEKGFLKGLTYKNFEVIDEKVSRKIEFFSFDEQSNQYIIGFSSEDYVPDNKWREVKVKVKLSAEEKKKFGKTSVIGQTKYYSNQN